MSVLLVVYGFALVIGIVAGIVAFAVAAAPLQQAGLPWQERARLTFPVRFAGGGLMFAMCVPISLMSAVLFNMAGTMPPPWVGLSVGLVSCLGVAIPGLWTVWKSIWPTVGFGKFVAGCVVAVLFRFPNAALMLAIMLVIVGADFNMQIALIGITFLTIGSIALIGGAGIFVLQFIGLARPALPRVANSAAWAGERLNIRPRMVYEVTTSRTSITSVYPATGMVVVPAGAVDLLDDRELVALLIWEMAQMARPKLITTIKIIDALTVAVMGGFLVYSRGRSASNLMYLWLGSLAVIFLVRSLARKAQLQADQSAAETGIESRDSLAALERVFERDLLPVVSVSNRAATPHLYDRMLKAGMTPAYPRPAPPSKARLAGAVACGLGVAVVSVVAVVIFCGASHFLERLL